MFLLCCDSVVGLNMVASFGGFSLKCIVNEDNVFLRQSFTSLLGFLNHHKSNSVRKLLPNLISLKKIMLSANAVRRKWWLITTWVSFSVISHC